MQKGKYACTKEDANAQGKMQTRKGRCKHARANANTQEQIRARAGARAVRGTAKGEEC